MALMQRSFRMPKCSGYRPRWTSRKLEGGYFVAGDGYVDPRQFAIAYANAARELGVSIELNTEVTGLRIAGGKVMGVETADGFQPADQVIVTAGPWTGLLASHPATICRCNRFDINEPEPFPLQAFRITIPWSA